MNCITVGKSKMGYVNIDLDTLSVFMGDNYNLNEKKYSEGKKKSKAVYTVIGLVSRNFEYKSFEGYIIANDKGEIKLVKEDTLVSILKKYYFMNYSLMTQVSEEDLKYFSRKNPKTIVKEFIDKDVRDILGYSFEDFSLSSDMNLNQIDFCMKNNGFKLGFKTDFPVEYFGQTIVGTHLIYYNKEGTQIILNYVNKKDRPLDYYHQTCIIMRNVNHKKYHVYLKENPYNSCSSSPLVDASDSNLDPDYTEMLFTCNKLERFLNVSEKAKTYSKPIVPYILGHNMYSLHSILNVTPYQDKKIREYLNEKGQKKWDYSSFMSLYMGYLNMLKYSDELKKYYSKCLIALPEYFGLYKETFSIPQKDIQSMKKFVENLA